MLTTRRRLFGRAANDLRIMHANLRILYVLIALTMVTAGVWWFQGGQGIWPKSKAQILPLPTRHCRQDFHCRHGRRTSTLTRPTQGSLWDVNGQFKAREDAVNLLLKTFLRARVQGPVPRRAAQRHSFAFRPWQEGRNLPGRRCPAKTWYVGTATPATQAPTWSSKPRKAEVLTLCRAHGGVHGIPQHKVFHF